MTMSATTARTASGLGPARAARVRSVRRILVAVHAVEAGSIVDALREDGYHTVLADDLVAAHHLATTGRYDMAVVAQRLLEEHGEGGLSTLPPLPVLVIGVEHGWDVVAALTAGAADAVADAPPEEVVARVRARLRARRAAVPPPLLLRSGALTLDTGARQARIGDRDVPLTAKEFAVIELFVRNPGRVLTRAYLLRHVWPETAEPASNIIDSTIARVRRKLGAGYVATERGLGYRLVG